MVGCRTQRALRTTRTQCDFRALTAFLWAQSCAPMSFPAAALFRASRWRTSTPAQTTTAAIRWKQGPRAAGARVGAPAPAEIRRPVREELEPEPGAVQARVGAVR